MISTISLTGTTISQKPNPTAMCIDFTNKMNMKGRYKPFGATGIIGYKLCLIQIDQILLE